VDGDLNSQPDSRLIAKVGNEEYKQLVEVDFNSGVGGTYKLLCRQGLTLFVVQIVVPATTEDGSLNVIGVLFRVALISTIIRFVIFQLTIYSRVAKIFEPWKVRGIDCHYYPGSKRTKPKIGFRCAAGWLSAQADLNEQPVMMMMQPQSGGMQPQPGGMQPQFGMMQPQYGAPQPALNFDPMTGQPLNNIQSQMQPGQQPNMYTATVTPMPMAMAKLMAMPTSAPVVDPNEGKVKVLVPIYGGGGMVMTEFNGNLVSVEIPADATAGAAIWVDPPEAYKGY